MLHLISFVFKHYLKGFSNSLLGVGSNASRLTRSHCYIDDFYKLESLFKLYRESIFRDFVFEYLRKFETVFKRPSYFFKQDSYVELMIAIYAPMIYTAPCIMFRRRAYPLQVFWAQNGIRLSAQCHFTGPKKLLISRAQPSPTCPSNGYSRIHA